MKALRWIHSLSIGIEGFDALDITPLLRSQRVQITTSKVLLPACTSRTRMIQHRLMLAHIMLNHPE